MSKILLYWSAFLLVFPLAAQNKLVGFSIYNVPGDGNSGGLIFSVNPDGTGLQILQNFSAAPAGSFVENTAPLALTAASDGKFYGVAQPCEPSKQAYVFSLNPDGTNFQIVFTLPYILDFWSLRPMSLFEGSDGWLYAGGLFRLRKDGTGYQVLCSDWSSGNFLEAADGRIYWMEGFDLMRIEKNGSAKKKVGSPHAAQVNEEPYSGRLYRLPNGSLFGQFDYVYDDYCNTFYSSSMIFTFNPVTNQLQTQELSDPWLSEMALGTDGYLYRPGARIDPNDLSVTVLPGSGCINLSNYLDLGLMTAEGVWIGHHINDSFDTHGILAWNPTDGTCQALLSGAGDFPYQAKIAFELAATTATHQSGDLSGNIQLSPNPVTSTLKVNTPWSRPVFWQLLDATGQCISAGQATSSWTVPMDQLSTGLYFLKMNGRVKKVLKG